LKNDHSAFDSGYTSLYFQQWWIRIPFHTLTALVCVIPDSLSDWSKGKSQCPFDFISPWPRMLNTSSCIYYSFVLVFLRLGCSVHLPFYLLCCWFFLGFNFWAPYIIWLLIPYKMYIWQRFSSILHAVSSV
jgi:hypothetical protein